MVNSDSQIEKAQCGHPKRAELLDVNINTGVQSINTESYFKPQQKSKANFSCQIVSSKHRVSWQVIPRRC